MLKKLFSPEVHDICPNCGEACAVTDVLCPKCGKNLDELFEQLPDSVISPFTLPRWVIFPIKISREWRALIRAILALVVLSGLTALSWYIISYFHKAAVLARLLDPKLTVVGDVADAEEYMIYNTIISYDFIQASTELVTIEKQTGLGLLDATDVRKDTKPKGLEISNETWNEFITKNSSSSKLGNAFTLSKPYVLFDPTDMVDMNLELSGANIHYTPFLEFSRVGFNWQKDEAVVHVSLMTLGRGKQPIGFSQGFYFWLRKLDGVWKIEKAKETYIT